MPLNRTIFNQTLYHRIRDIWFAGVPRSAAAPPQEALQRWFPRDSQTKAEFDAICTREFSSALEAIGPQTSHHLIQSDFIAEIDAQPDETACSNTALSIILLLDQISRNRYRTRETLPRVYQHYDQISQSVLKHILNKSPRPDLQPEFRYSYTYRIWFYMPLMHSEQLSDHNKMLRLLDDFKTDLQAQDQQDALDYLDKATDFEQQHKSLIDRFGRYPHRNACLDRPPTDQETQYLSNNGETFGVEG